MNVNTLFHFIFINLPLTLHYRISAVLAQMYVRPERYRMLYRCRLFVATFGAGNCFGVVHINSTTSYFSAYPPRPALSHPHPVGNHRTTPNVRPLRHNRTGRTGTLLAGLPSSSRGRPFRLMESGCGSGGSGSFQFNYKIQFIRFSSPFRIARCYTN